MADTKINHTGNEVQTARLSLPVKKPFRLVIDVTPVFTYCAFPSILGDARRKDGPVRYDICVTMEEREEENDE